MEEEPFVLEAEYPVGEKGKVRVIFEFYLKEEFKDLEVDDARILEGLQDLLGDMPTGICTNVAASILILPFDFELSKRLIDVVSIEAREEPPIVPGEVPFVKDKERDFLTAYQ